MGHSPYFNYSKLGNKLIWRWPQAKKLGSLISSQTLFTSLYLKTLNMFGLFSLVYDRYFNFTEVELDISRFLAQIERRMDTSQDICNVYWMVLNVIFYKTKMFCLIFGFPYYVVALPSGCCRNLGIWTNRNAWHDGRMPKVWSSNDICLDRGV